MNNQEIFDKIVAHLRQQGKKSMMFITNGMTRPEMSCAYRGENGTSCAIGCLIPDNEYSSVFEGGRFSGVMRYAVHNGGEDKFPTIYALSDHSNFLLSMQDVHDSYPPTQWEERFAIVAFNYQLQYNEPTKNL